MNMIKFEEERIEVQNHDGLESYVFCLLFRVDKSIDEVLSLHLNSNYGEITCREDFESYNYFPKFITGDFYLISKALSDGIPNEVFRYFEEAWHIYKKDISADLNSNINTLRIKFTDTDYKTYAEIVESICNAFLTLLPSKKILEFSKELVFTCSYDALPFEFYTKKTSINYTALVYLIQKDLTKLTYFDITRIKKDVFNSHILFNPFFDTQFEIIDKIKDIFYRLGKIKVNKTKTGNKDIKYKRIFDIYLMTTYPTIYFMSDSIEKLTNKEICQKLLELGYSYGDILGSDSILTSKYNRQVKRDLNLIEQLKKIDIPFDDYVVHNGC